MGQVLTASGNQTLLDALAETLKAPSALIAIALNNNTSIKTLVALAGRGQTKVCDVIGRNAERALRYPDIIEALFFNPNAPQGVVQNLLELAVREGLPRPHAWLQRDRQALLGGSAATTATSDAPLNDIDFLSAVGGRRL